MELVKGLNIYTYDEILEKVRGSYGRARGVEGKLQAVRDIIVSRTEDVEKLASLLEGLHGFYWRLVEVEFDRGEIEGAVRCVRKARFMVDKLWGRYRYIAMAAGGERGFVREGVGRMLSLVKRCRRGLLVLKNLVVFLQGLPSINPEEPIVIVAGPPNAGKSTFVRSVSTAKPEVANYPFTTKQVTVGHRDYGVFRVQVIDTPGLLDRPVEEMNPIERRAAAALSELRGTVIFMLDPTRGSYMSLERQVRVAWGVWGLIGGKPLYVVVNKVDIADSLELESALRAASDLVGRGLASGVYTVKAVDRDSASKILDDIVAKEFTGYFKV
ncbi:MAG: 50S ribosome-binding GTPase [Thermoprotei archaeon]|nr:50S ribosome-binding GTPase [Thermoprotei archaeon]